MSGNRVMRSPTHFTIAFLGLVDEYNGFRAMRVATLIPMAVCRLFPFSQLPRNAFAEYMGHSKIHARHNYCRSVDFHRSIVANVLGDILFVV